MDKKDIILNVLVVLAIIGAVALAIASICALISSIDWSAIDTGAERPSSHQITTPANNSSDCSILADKCIVDEWELKCLLVDCIVDGRK